MSLNELLYHILGKVLNLFVLENQITIIAMLLSIRIKFGEHKTADIELFFVAYSMSR